MREHGRDFVPDEILHVSFGTVNIACSTRPSVLINGTTPGPEIRLKPGRPTWIRVYNDIADQNTTMHWHGLSQRAAIFSDGTPSASQWPIAPLHFFDYEIFPEKGDAGTYFYHSHVGFQAVSSTGPLIVEDHKEPPYSYDEERVIQFTDYFEKNDSAVVGDLTGVPFTWSGETDAVLVNGVGVSASANQTQGTGNCGLPVISVEPGKTYRMRFIGGTALSMVQFAIVGHSNLTIVGADGQYTQPHAETFMQVTSGQRFDVIFQAKTAEELAGETDYLIQFETKNRPAVYHGYGVLRYSPGNVSIVAAPSSPPLALSNATYDWLEYALEPLKPNNFPTAAEVTRRVDIDLRQVATDTIIWRANGLQWNESSVPYAGDVPYLVQIYRNGESAIPDYDAALNNSGWDPATYTWPAKIGEVLEIVWHNTGSLVKNNGGLDFHPFHAHGGHYYDIGSGNGTYDQAANEERLKTYNPVLRDTTNLYKFASATDAGNEEGWRAWRLRVEDAGVWMVHCHILQHMVMGKHCVAHRHFMNVLD
ncbi:multicopper oxidase [Polychaeton citri CBS 116435]|uniref:Multicopper oxidase n=1 Tax=Polychaeton citri CBS 116435 TaxID=1314669 RepID=A0A9P4QDV5_9PEZI|nr:multicopper oxidase [Polychaeton citri CBS 116435]